MKVWLRSLHMDVVINLFRDFFAIAHIELIAGKMEAEFPDDRLYREVIGWISDAIGCGLISEYRMERM